MENFNKVFINLLLILATIVFAIGIWAPLLTLKKLIFMKSTFSVLSGISQLYNEGQYGLFVLIAGFTLLLPVVKMMVLFVTLNGKNELTWQRRYVGWLSLLGKWSMLDVFVVAVLIASVKLGSIAKIEIHYGLYVFASSVLLMMVSTHLILRRVKQHPVQPHRPVEGEG
jgi:paraquat-inducible protein A